MELSCVSLAGFMVTFGGIHFNFFSLGKQDSSMAISARKKKYWHVREQMRHIFIFNPTNLKTATTHDGIQEAGLLCIASDYFILHKYSHKFSP
jgi:hypothetical protein